MPRVLLAFDKFKGSLTAAQACAAAAEALRVQHPRWTLDLCPLADGGEGFAGILTRAVGGALHQVTVAGPCSDPVAADYGLVPAGAIPEPARALLGLPVLATDADVALVEMAQASGLALLPPARRDPWQTSTRGTGQVIQAAVARGAQAVVLGVGGSATHDLGLGVLGALGLEFFSDSGELLVPPVPATWARLARIGGRIAPSLPPLRIACDVDHPLLGRRGAAAVFGPQKGLAAGDLRRLEHASARVGLMLGTYAGQPDALMDVPGAGAAGGTAFGLLCAAGARLVPGSALVAAWLGLEARLAAADLVLTGEGCFDAGSLAGKGPGAVVTRALALGRPVHVFAGQSSLDSPPAGAALHIITPADTPEAVAMRDAAANLARMVRAVFL